MCETSLFANNRLQAWPDVAWRPRVATPSPMPTHEHDRDDVGEDCKVLSKDIRLPRHENDTRDGSGDRSRAQRWRHSLGEPHRPLLSLRLSRGVLQSVSRGEPIQSGQHEQAQQGGGNDSPNHHRGERPLDFRTCPCIQGHGQEA